MTETTADHANHGCARSVTATSHPPPRRAIGERIWRFGSIAAISVFLVATFVVVSAPRSESAPTDDPDAGAEVYQQHCAMCHGSDGSGMMGMHPALRGAVQRLSVEGVAVTVRNGRATTPPMPAFGDRLSDAQIDNVIAYVESLPDGPRNFGPGGEGGMGGEMMDGTPILMWVLILVLVAGVAGLVGHLVGRNRGATS